MSWFSRRESKVYVINPQKSSTVEDRSICADENADSIPFETSKEELVKIHQSRDFDLLEQAGGVIGLAKALRTDLKSGLSQAEEEQSFRFRRKEFGENVNPEAPSSSFFKLFWVALQDTTLRILMLAATISIVVGTVPALGYDNEAEACSQTVQSDHEGSGGEKVPGYVEGLAILAAVFAVATVTSVNEFQKERQFRSLNNVKNNRKVTVVRNGHTVQISIFDVNVGEIVQLDTGDQVPADGLFIEGYGLETDESAMTGESDGVKKDAERAFMLSGCQVVAGVGSMLVTAVGESSEWGQTLSKLNESEDDETPLQQKLEIVAKTIGKVGTCVATVTFIALCLRFGIEVARACSDKFRPSWLTVLLDFFILGVTIVVVAVPEGLPLAVTISLAYSMKKMMRDQNLVRHLAACEIMGGATNICSDKTGTLTQNRMTVVQCYLAGTHYTSMPPASEFDPLVLRILAQSIAINSKAFFTTTPTGTLELVGNKTEGAMLTMVNNVGFDYQEIRDATVIRSLYAFSSEKKRMSTLVHMERGFRLYTKGASETVLDLCDSVITSNGLPSPLSPDAKTALLDLIATMASSGLRTLCLAYRDFEYDGGDDWAEAPEAELVLVAIVGIKDPLRPDVPEAVLSCRRAGITVRMVTGDNLLTAKHIAHECNILTDGIAMEGPQFRKLTQQQLDEVLPRLQVLARSLPSDKHALVHRLRELGEVVAVTGDGTNDAPALKESDVGLAMGIAGTEVAKEASDIILMDDNFSSIVKAVMWGRCVYDNIRKFVQFQLTVNIVALVVAFVGAVSGKGRPLKPIQLLWVNLIMDTMGALALGTQLPTTSLLDRKPYGRFESLISPEMWRNMLGQAAFQIVVQMVLLFHGEQLFSQWISEAPVAYVNTMVFNTFVFCQIFNEINCRSIAREWNVFAGLLSNPLFTCIVLSEALIQVIIVEFGSAWFATHSLPSHLWIISISIAAVSLPIGALLRFVPIWNIPFRVPFMSARCPSATLNCPAPAKPLPSAAATTTTTAASEKSSLPTSRFAKPPLSTRSGGAARNAARAPLPPARSMPPTARLLTGAFTQHSPSSPDPTAQSQSQKAGVTSGTAVALTNPKQQSLSTMSPSSSKGSHAQGQSMNQVQGRSLSASQVQGLSSAHGPSSYRDAAPSSASPVGNQGSWRARTMSGTGGGVAVVADRRESGVGAQAWRTSQKDIEQSDDSEEETETPRTKVQAHEHGQAHSLILGGGVATDARVQRLVEASPPPL